MEKIAVMGTGVVGQMISEKLSSLGHEVRIGTRDINNALSREEKDAYGRPGLAEWLKQNPNIKLSTFSEAAEKSEIIVTATNGSGTLPALDQAGNQNLSNKVLIDISNPLDFSKGFPPSLTISNTDSLGEQIQRKYPSVKVVKTLNTMTSFLMVNPSLIKEDHNVFLSGNDEAAKLKVRSILSSFGWQEKNMIDLGDLSTARGTEQLLPIWVRLYGRFKNAMFNFNIVKAEG